MQYARSPFSWRQACVDTYPSPAGLSWKRLVAPGDREEPRGIGEADHGKEAAWATLTPGKGQTSSTSTTQEGGGEPWALVKT